jgi:DNA-damage-inducible protein J
MPENAVVRARIDERTKKEAAAALSKIGLTVSDAFRLLLVRIAAEKALPFEPLDPNAAAVAAMKAARRGELVSAGKPDKLLRSLNARDSIHEALSTRLQARAIRLAWKEARRYVDECREPARQRHSATPPMLRPLTRGRMGRSPRLPPQAGFDSHLPQPDKFSLELVRRGSHSELGM